MELWSVDRIEGDIAVLINTEKKIMNIPVSLFLQPVVSGDIVIQDSFGNFFVDSEKTVEKKRKLFELQKKIFSDL